MSTSATLVLEGARTPVAAGLQTTLMATVTNTGTTAEDFILSARDIEPAWLTFRPPALTLAPGQQGSLTILLNVPADAVIQPAVPVLRLLAQSSGQVVAEAPLTAAPVATATTVPFTPVTGAHWPAAPRAVPHQLLVAGGLAAALVALVAMLLIRHAHQSPPPSALGSLSCGGQPTKVASLLSDDTTTAIRLSNSDFSDMRVLRTEPAAVLPGLFDSLLALSDDNSRIAYVTANNESMDEAHLWTISANAPGQPLELAHIPTGFWAVRPVWSPDNRQIAFLALDPALAAQHKTQLVLWIAGLGGQLRQINNLPQLRPEDFYGDHKTPVCWAADNRTVIFDGVGGQPLSAGQANVTTLTGTSMAGTSPPPRQHLRHPSSDNGSTAAPASPVDPDSLHIASALIQHPDLILAGSDAARVGGDRRGGDDLAALTVDRLHVGFGSSFALYANVRQRVGVVQSTPYLA